METNDGGNHAGRQEVSEKAVEKADPDQTEDHAKVRGQASARRSWQEGKGRAAREEEVMLGPPPGLRLTPDALCLSRPAWAWNAGYARSSRLETVEVRASRSTTLSAHHSTVAFPSVPGRAPAAARPVRRSSAADSAEPHRREGRWPLAVRSYRATAPRAVRRLRRGQP